MKPARAVTSVSLLYPPKTALSSSKAPRERHAECHRYLIWRIKL
jgi:hypothetical protein